MVFFIFLKLFRSSVKLFFCFRKIFFFRINFTHILLCQIQMSNKDHRSWIIECGLKFLPRTQSEIAGHIDHQQDGCTLYFHVLLLQSEGRFPESCSMKLKWITCVPAYSISIIIAFILIILKTLVKLNILHMSGLCYHSVYHCEKGF